MHLRLCSESIVILDPPPLVCNGLLVFNLVVIDFNDSGGRCSFSGRTPPWLSMVFVVFASLLIDADELGGVCQFSFRAPPHYCPIDIVNV